jgi:hypothetical protein
MSKLYMDSSELLASIKLRAAVPLAQISFTDADLLNFATEEIDLKIVPSILSVREEFYVTTETVPLVANQSNYKIPYRAIGGKVRYVYLLTSDGTSRPLAQIGMEFLPDYQATSFSFQEAGFYLQSDELVILPPIQGTVTSSLVMKYYMKPNKVVPMSRGGQITSITERVGNTTLTDIVISTTMPTNFTTGSEVDFIQAKSNHKTKGYDITVQAVSAASRTITINTVDVPSELIVGDFVCTAGETVIPQVPSELQVMVAQAVACRVLEAIGDTQGLANANAKLQEMEVKLLSVIDSRVEAPGRKVKNPNTFIGNSFNRRLRRY